MQMVHEFNTNGYIYTERELKSGKNYKMIMKKAYKISEYHNEKASGRDSDSMQMPQLSQMPVKGSRVLSIPQIDLTQKKLNSEVELNFVPSLVKGSLPEAENIAEKDSIKFTPQNIRERFPVVIFKPMRPFDLRAILITMCAKFIVKNERDIQE